MRENRQSGSEGGGTEPNRFSLPLLKTYWAWAHKNVLGVGSQKRVCNCASKTVIGNYGSRVSRVIYEPPT